MPRRSRIDAASIEGLIRRASRTYWIYWTPAFAGVTRKGWD